jgi:hypothetical protein
MAAVGDTRSPSREEAHLPSHTLRRRTGAAPTLRQATRLVVTNGDGAANASSAARIEGGYGMPSHAGGTDMLLPLRGAVPAPAGVYGLTGSRSHGGEDAGRMPTLPVRRSNCLVLQDSDKGSHLSHGFRWILEICPGFRSAEAELSCRAEAFENHCGVCTI